MKLLIENWRKFLTEISAPEAKWFGPAFQEIADDPDVLISAWDREGKVAMLDDGWIKKNIGPFLGAGYSRTVYAMKDHPNLVFKIADNMIEEGRYTNGEEKKMFNKYPEFFPRVWMTAKHVESSPYIRAMTYDDEHKVAKSDNLYLDWIIVDRVRPLKRDNFDEFLGKKFPVLDQIIKEMPWRQRRTMVTGQQERDGIKGILRPALPLKFREKLFSKFLYSLEINIPSHRHGLGGIKTWLNRELSFRAADKVVDKVWDIMIKDPKLAKVSEVVTAADMRTDEIRADNLGTDMATGTKLIFLDINKFLFKQGAMDP